MNVQNKVISALDMAADCVDEANFASLIAEAAKSSVSSSIAPKAYKDACNVNYNVEEIKILGDVIVSVYKDMYALSFHVKHLKELSSTDIRKLNKKLSSLFPNAIYDLVLHKGKLLFKLGANEMMELEEEDILTIQGRSWEDYCLQIINLEQNYRWEKTYIYG